ncbi:MAG: 3-ketoacyl-ACP reductase [Treponema sp.]|jgi:NAD(P)-dependent dehydrogenase (short-subunit alcohol dehydrogenase family)|nr:3-ketoacyl-ACP reductase [Treponema sp.]
MKKIAIVTGGTRGIGFAISARLGEDGFALALVGTREEGACGRSLEALRGLTPDILYIQADVSRTEDRKKIVDKTAEHFGAIHVLVNNAGVAPKLRADLLEMTEESYDFVMNTNTRSVMFLTQLAVKRMLSQPISGGKRGTVINIGSCSAEVSSVNRGEYCVSKAGISMLTKLYGDRLAREGIFVHEIRPGIIKTDMTAGVTEKYDSLIEAGTFPIGRWGTPEDVARAVAAFAGDNFLYTTGNVVDVDGGFHIRRL